MRLFIAIQLPPEVKKYLLEIQKKFQQTGKITFTKESHLTLKFLGEVLPAKAKQIEKKLKSIVFQPFNLTLSGIGFFPDEHNARVIWIGLQLNNDINELHQNIDAVLEKFFGKEKNFVPHLTLGRIKTITDKKKFAKVVESIAVKPLQIKVNTFSLIKSELGNQGPKYTLIKEYSAV